MAREAFYLSKEIDFDDLSLKAAATALKEVRDKVAEIEVKEPRDWVRSEAESALFWAYRSPDVAPGIYASVDIGAGTTSASWFRINAVRMGGVLLKDRLSFFGADCRPPGCDAIDNILFGSGGFDSRADVRGQENPLIDQMGPRPRRLLDKVLEAMADVFGNASTNAFQKNKSMKAWRDCGRVFLLGGGSKISVVREAVVQRKKSWLMDDPVVQAGTPPDLFEVDGSNFQDDSTFLLVAYGLAHRLADVPDIRTPTEIEDFTPSYGRIEPIHHGDLYSD
jgi:hypothetical protein